MVAKTTQMVAEDDELTPAQLTSAAVSQSPEGLAKLDAANKKTTNIQALTQQILGQNQTNKWTGEGWGSAEKNAEAMAKMLDASGITDIKQFGKVDKYEPVEVTGYSLNGNTVQNPEKGVFYEMVPQSDGEGGTVYTNRFLSPQEAAKVKPQYGIVETDADGGRVVRPVTNVTEKNGQLVGVTGQTFGNKATGQAIDSGYGRWQNQGGDNLFGGTGEGKGNTGYRVQFTDDGSPIFYTTQGTSNDLAQLMTDLGPIGQIGLAVATGGMSLPAQLATNFAIQVLSGADLKDAIKNTAVNLAVAQIPGTDFMKEVNLEINKLGLDSAVTNTLKNAAQGAATSATRAALTGKSILDSALTGAASGGVNGAVGEIMKGIPDFDKLTPAQQRMASNAITGVISGKPLDQVIVNTAIAAANAEIHGSQSQSGTTKAPTTLSAEDYDLLDPAEKKIYDEQGMKALTEHQTRMGDIVRENKKIDKTLESIEAGSTPNSDSGLSNRDIEELIGITSEDSDTKTTTGTDTENDVVKTLEDAGLTKKADDNVLVTGKSDKTLTSSEDYVNPIDDYFKPTKSIEELLVTGKSDKESTAETPTYSPIDDYFKPTKGLEEILITGKSEKPPTEPSYLATDDDFPRTPIKDEGEITVTGKRPALKPELDLSTDPVKLITDPLQPTTLPPTTQPPTTKPTTGPSGPSINIDPVKQLEEFYNPFTPTRSAPVQTDTGPIQLMTDVFGTDISKAQKTGARGYGFSAGGDIDELLRLLRS